MMEYYLDTFGPDPIIGTGDTLEAAIQDAVETWLNQILLEEGKSWANLYLKIKFQQRKSAIFSAAQDYDPVELIEMNAEARDYALTGNTTPARYPLANGLAVARGVMLVSVLVGWRDAFLAAYSGLVTLIHHYDTAKAAIEGAGTKAQLINVMTAILEALES